MRKHRTALAIIGLYLLVFFFPTLFMGRVVSPNDVYRHYEPWSQAGFMAQNPVIHDPPLAYMPIAAMMKRAPESFHWNPWLASGIPGWGSAASALLTPFVLIPALLPIALFYSAIILIKFLFAYLMGYLWLREERLGKSRAAIGALVGAAAGPMFVLWLWQSTNATVLYPAVLYAMARMFNGKRNSIVLLTLMGICFLLSGYPASIVFAIWLALFYVIVQWVRTRRLPFREVGKGLLAIALALAVTAPVLDPFVSFLDRSGYLEWREEISQFSFAPSDLIGLLDPEYLGNPAKGLWRGSRDLGSLDNYIELTIWVGPIVLFLSLVSLFDTRARGRAVGWIAFGTLVGLIMVGLVDHDWILDLPGLRFSPTTRLRVFLPWVFAFLAASGTRGLSHLLGRINRRQLSAIVLIVAVILAVDYARVAATFYPYLPLGESEIDSHPSIEILQVTGSPFRVAPTFYWMMPNSAQMFGVEDVRSQWSSESAYREIIRRIDPGAGSAGTLLFFNSLTMNVEDPFLRLLNVRYVIEPPAIDILQWRIEERLESKGVPDGKMVLDQGESLRSFVRIPSSAAKTIEVTAWPADTKRPKGRLSVETRRPETGRVEERLAKRAPSLARRSKLHVPVTQFRMGEVVELTISAEGGSFVLPTTAGEPFLRISNSSLALIDEGRAARVFELVDSLPRYRATWEMIDRTAQDILADPSFDFSRQTLIDPTARQTSLRLSEVPVPDRRVQFRILQYEPGRQMVETEAGVPFLFTASEKLTPELSVYVDGEEVSPMEVNGIFVGIPIEPGTHTIVLERRIGRGWWLLSMIGMVALVGAGIVDRRW
ncbi:MAG: YfhO family protein [Acidobacteria bacterium]|nr:YfhO family protein [Acidobacteriota bacterium]